MLYHCFPPSTELTPYQVVYGQSPLTIPEYLQGSTSLEAIESELTTRDQILQELTHNLTKARSQMKLQADAKRKYLEFKDGDLNYVAFNLTSKIQLLRELQ